MKRRRLGFLAHALALSFAIFACHDDNGDVTGANQSLVRLSVDAPDTARSASQFGVQVRALNVGVSGVHSGRVSVTLPSPLVVISVNAPSGTNATFTNGASGGSVVWELGTLDSNSEDKLDISAAGTLLPTEGTRKLTIAAQMTAQGINPGEAMAQDDVTLVQ